MEQATLVYDYLLMLKNGYTSGDFAPVFPCLAQDCVMESQWVMEPNVGYDAVTDYLIGKAKTLKRTEKFPCGSIWELVGNTNPVRNAEIHTDGEKTEGMVSLYYPSGEWCLLLEQTIEDKTNKVVLRIQLNEEDQIARIDLCMPELFQSRYLRDYLLLYPAMEDGRELEEGRVMVNDHYYGEVDLFLGKVDIGFATYINLTIPMEDWIAFLDHWKRFYDARSFDEAFETACGIDYTRFTVEDEDARQILVNVGDQIWANRNHNRNMLEGLIEWTEKYKDEWTHINLYGV